MAKGKSKKINNKPKYYKIYNTEEKSYLSIIGYQRRMIWQPLRFLADVFSAIKIDSIEEDFPELDLKKYDIIEISEEEKQLDEEKLNILTKTN